NFLERESPMKTRTGFRPKLESMEDRCVPSATTLVFHLDPAHSHLTASGSINAGPLGQFALKAQQAGSLRTSISGAITASVDLAAHTISFDSAGTSLVAANGHVASPGINGDDGTAPAAIAGVVSAKTPVAFAVDLALRDGVGTLSTDTPLTL